MTQEDKQLLLKDISARLPYGTEISLTDGTSGMITSISIVPHGTFVTVYFNRDNVEDVSLEEVKPYLRLMSSMTEKEQHEYDNSRLDNLALSKVHLYYPMRWHTMDYLHVDWLNAHHFDYRGLIPKGLALVAPEGMYKKD